jgi:16S rRNA (guanine527-N7)-methyltransferase
MKNESLKSSEEFIGALAAHAPQFGVDLTDEEIAKLRDYYELVNAWNARLHLVAPCSPKEFAKRHVLESLLANRFLSHEARVADIGSGAGLPAIPCLIARTDISVTLIESSSKKTIFLREALERVNCHERANILAERFEKIIVHAVDFITCRALDCFPKHFPTLLSWSPPASTLLLFGGNFLHEQIEDAALNYNFIRIPESERRFLFIIKKEKM